MPPTRGLNPSNGSSSFTAEVDRVGRNEWSALLRRFDDAHIVQTWDFAEAIAPRQRVSRLVLRKDREAVALAQVRIVTVPLLSRGIAHVSFGPLWRGENPPLTGGHLKLRSPPCGKSTFCVEDCT